MCTIIVFNRVHPRYPVVVAANRDEFYARETTGPVVLSDQPRVVGGRDQERGGTWMGVTAGGLFVGLTNQRSDAPRTRAPKSRGEVVLRALRSGSADGVHRLLDTLDSADYESFNLIYGDAEHLHVAYSRRHERGIEIVDVAEGISVLSNDRLDADDFPKMDRARELAVPVAKQPWPQLLGSLQTVLADHQLPDDGMPDQTPPDAPFGRGELRKLQALCVHTQSYGTRSATVVALGNAGVAHYCYAPGPPCTTDLVDSTGYVSGK